MKVIFIRHGHTNYNQLGFCNDDPKRDVFLTETGIQQANELTEKLRAYIIDLIIVSELPRTRQTADIINQNFHSPIVVHPALNDIRTGFDGDSVADYFAAIAVDPLYTGINGGESLIQYKNRVLPYIYPWRLRFRC